MATTRWFGIALRAIHLIAVIFLGAQLLGHTGADAQGAAAVAVLLSGIALFALDSIRYPSHLSEVAGASVMAKLLLVAAMALFEPLRLPLYWLVVAWSVLFAHAPASFRHRRLGAAAPLKKREIH